MAGVGVRKVWRAILGALALALVLPCLAHASTFTVDSTADEADASPGVAGCSTAAGKCTLRAAIEESNLTGASANEIKFDGNVFSGQAAATIDLGSGLPPITEPVRIDGGRCQTEAGVLGPCVAINGTNSSAALTIESDETTVANLHILNASTGIKVTAVEGFDILGNWFGGGPLSGPLQGGDGTAVLAGPGAGGGLIGGKESTEGNLFLSGGTGLYIHGASHVKVLGNQFGFAPDGTFLERDFLIDIEVTSAPNAGYEAVGNEIGTTLSEAAFATPACDGGCNLLTGAEYTLDLFSLGSAYGEDGPPVETTIAGNDVGLNPAGTKTFSPTGRVTGEGPRTVIGGPDARDGNRIDGVYDAISGSGPELVIANNLIGVDYSGSEVLGPAHEGIRIFADHLEDPSQEALVVGNEVVVDGGTGISNSGLGATIADNEVVGADLGIYTQEDQGLQGNLIEANSIEDSTEEGIYLEDSDNEVVGNEVVGSTNADIHIGGQQPAGATGNQIGGNTEESENKLSLSGGPAVSIYGREESENEVARNFGFENEGPFILLSRANSSEGWPNGDIEPPEISTATDTGASGMGVPGALVRLFENQFEDEGELESFVGQTHVKSNGEWSLGFAARPPGTVLAATQTQNGGTSELELAPTPGPPPEEHPVASAGESKSTPPLSLPALETKIIGGPRRRGGIVRFRFRSNRPNATFECKLDRRSFRPCHSPATYRNLVGRHVFEVRAVGGEGEFDPSPARRTFSIHRAHRRRGTG